jgi:tetratricopeptide (TPR) repeat protein
VLTNLSLVLAYQERPRESAETADRAQQIALQRRDDPGEASIWSNLALVHQARGRPEEAKELQERALRIIEKMLGDQHPLTAEVLIGMARDLRQLGDLRSAHERFQRAVAIEAAVYGEDHPKLAQTLREMAAVLDEQGDQIAAASAQAQADAIAGEGLPEAKRPEAMEASRLLSDEVALELSSLQVARARATKAPLAPPAE